MSTNYSGPGDRLTVTAPAAVSAGDRVKGGYLFGVALNDVAINTPGEFLVDGVVDIAKTSVLVIAVGDRVFWDAANKVVNKTTTAQQCVGIAVEAAANPSATVKIKLGHFVPSAT